MSRRAERNLMVAGVTVPFLAFIVAVVLLWNNGVGWLDLGIMVCFYIFGQLGITIGYHRMLTHKSFEPKTPVKVFWAVAASFAVQGTPAAWVADHRRHHAYTDVEGDPHSPHLHGHGFWGSARGLWHAHVGWLIEDGQGIDEQRFAPDILEDKWLNRVGRYYGLIFICTLAFPAAIGFIIGGTWTAALTALLWGGFVRIFLAHHFTWSVNSICHVFGNRPFAVEETDLATNFGWLAIPSMGEAWHHNHHAFPRSAYHGLRWYQIDPSKYVIKAMEKLGLVTNVITISEERQEQKLLANGAERPAPRHRPSIKDESATAFTSPDRVVGLDTSAR
ncbi:MAG: acyl-CoA desaturase [Solirubrobacteraceae bacterium]|nr:acyl-CoA desaturase [Solirubrobacteraceae bacterium]